MTLPRISFVVFGFITWLLPLAATGDVVFNGVGTAGTGETVHFRATFSVFGDNLTLELENLSSDPVLNPNAMLSSVYFDIEVAGARPVLSGYGAIGNVYLSDKNNPDSLQSANANLVAAVANDNTWQFKSFNPLLSPFAGFGLGTVGNNGLTPNNFNGNITGAIDYSIFAGEITTQNLDSRLLVKDKITFSFTGVSGFSESDIRNVTFGLGTGPDSLLVGSAVPEPGSVGVLACLAGAMILRNPRRRSSPRD
jgi:hypothetical protein